MKAWIAWIRALLGITEKHECKFDIHFTQDGTKFKRCSHPGCNSAIMVDWIFDENGKLKPEYQHLSEKQPKNPL